MKNNKGFSLVELIIVIAIMAVLIGVLAPQYLRYVEKSKKQADLSAVADVYNAVKIAYSDPEFQSKLSADTISLTNGCDIATQCHSTIGNDIAKTCGTTLSLTSNTYKNTTFTITITLNADKEWEITRDAAWEATINQ